MLNMFDIIDSFVVHHSMLCVMMLLALYAPVMALHVAALVACMYLPVTYVVSVLLSALVLMFMGSMMFETFSRTLVRIRRNDAVDRSIRAADAWTKLAAMRVSILPPMALIDKTMALADKTMALANRTTALADRTMALASRTMALTERAGVVPVNADTLAFCGAGIIRLYVALLRRAVIHFSPSNCIADVLSLTNLMEGMLTLNLDDGDMFCAIVWALPAVAHICAGVSTGRVADTVDADMIAALLWTVGPQLNFVESLFELGASQQTRISKTAYRDAYDDLIRSNQSLLQRIDDATQAILESPQGKMVCCIIVVNLHLTNYSASNVSVAFYKNVLHTLVEHHGVTTITA
jgi:hypothetical protein